MSRLRKNLWSALVLSLLAFSCEKNQAPEEPIDIHGLWDLTIFQADPNLSNYLIEVIVAGGTGVAQIMVYNNLGDKSGPDLVNADQPIALGSCGVQVIFSDTTSGALNLNLGDRWNITVADGIAYEPEADPDNQSVAKLTVQGTYTCLKPACDTGLYQTMVPLAYDVKVGSGLQEYELSQFKVNQTDANFTGSVTEENVLSLYLVGHQKKEEIQLCYKRKLHAEQGTNYFRVRLVDTHRYLRLDNKSGDRFSSPEETVCHSFKPQAKEVRIDFIFSLANFNSVAWLDQVREKINGTTVFSYDFESGSLDNDLGPGKMRWQLRSPGYQQGSALVSNIRPLEGNFSFRAMGGRNLPLTGSVLEQASTEIASLLGQVPGMDISGVLFEIYENYRGGYYSSLSGALQAEEAILGTFTGEKEGCRDQGQFIVAINQSKIYPVNGVWTMSIEGQAQNCKGVGNFREEFVPFRPVQKADRFYTEQNRPVLDRYANPYQLNGRVVGTALYFVLEDWDELDYRNALFSGIINTSPQQGDSNTPAEPNVAGTFNGWLGFKKDRKCQANGTFQVVFPQAQ